MSKTIKKPFIKDIFFANIFPPFFFDFPKLTAILANYGHPLPLISFITSFLGKYILKSEKSLVLNISEAINNNSENYHHCHDHHLNIAVDIKDIQTV